MIVGEIYDFDVIDFVLKFEYKKMDCCTVFGMYLVMQVVVDCGLDFNDGDLYRRGVVYGFGIGGIIIIEMGYLKIFDKGLQ